MLKSFTNRSIQIHNNKYDYSLVEYKNNRTKVKIICSVHGVFEQSPKSHLRGSECPVCSNNKKWKKFTKNQSDLIKEFINVHNDKYDYSLVEYKNSHTKIIVLCTKHGEFNITPSHHLNGVGCSKCANNYKYSTSEFIIKSNIIHDNKYDYSLVEYKNNKTKIKIICHVHDVFEQLPYHHLNKSGCPKCNSSKGETKVRNFLKKNNIEYTEQKRFNSCKYKKPLPFDFYLKEQNICIEYDGEFHFKPIRGKQNLKDTKRNDSIKNEFCEKNNMNLIRIPYYNINKINEILTNKL